MKTRRLLSSGLHALIWKEGKWYVAKGVEVEMASQGKSKEEAIKNLNEAIELYFTDEQVKIPSGLEDIELHQLAIS